MILVGKTIVCLIWIFWIMVIDNPVMGQDNTSITLEYNPTYGTTFDRVIKRGYIICGTNDEFPGFSEEVYDSESGAIWEGFDVDICKAVAAAVFGDSGSVQYEIIDGVS